jgi:CRAL/TRIO domain
MNATNFDLMEAQKLLILNFQLRSKSPEIFYDRSFNSEAIQSFIKRSRYISLSYRTQENYRIGICTLGDKDSRNYDQVNFMKFSVALPEAILLAPDPLDNGHITIVDAKNFTFRHLIKVVAGLRLLRNYMEFVENGTFMRVVRNHFINISPAVEKLLNLTKKMVSKKIGDSFIAHSNLSSLYEHVPREVLPIEYGGDAGHLDDLFRESLEKIEENFKYIADDSNWKLLSD